jgi:hypothetical protein
MNIEEIYNLTEWIAEEVTSNQIGPKYQELINKVSQNVNPRNANQAAQPFDQEKEVLLDSLKQIKIFSLSNQQIEVLKKIDTYEALGSHAANYVDELFYKKGLDLPTVLSELQKLYGKIQTLEQRSKLIKDSLNGIISSEGYEIDEDSALLKFHFQHNAEITNVVDLKKWMSELYDISRGLCITQDLAPESIRVVSAESGSLIITLSVAVSAVMLFSRAIMEILKIVEKAQVIKKQALEIRNLELNNEKIERELLKEAEEHVKVKRKELIESLIEEFAPTIDGEQKNALEKSLSKLMTFIEKGGEVDCYLPKIEEEIDSEDESESYELILKLKNDFSEIRILDSRIKMIEFYEE